MGDPTQRVLAIILARGGSKGIPGKNQRPLAGIPLLVWGIGVLQQSAVCGRIVVSTDDTDLMAIARAAGAEAPFRRPPELAADDTPSLPALGHAVRTLAADDAELADRFPMTLLYQVTSPLCEPQQVAAAVTAFAAGDAHFLKSVVEVSEHPHWMGEITPDGRLRYLFSERATRRQELPACFRLNGALSIYETARLLAGEPEVGEPQAFVMDALTSLDIDTDEDWARAEASVARQRDHQG